MADVHNAATRSYNMSRIKGKNTQPEMLVRTFLHAHGYRYRLHDKKLPGKPDLVLRKYGTVIFIHGCFWHGHSDCKYYVVPKTRTDWWLNKINGNVANDDKAITALKKRWLENYYCLGMRFKTCEGWQKAGAVIEKNKQLISGKQCCNIQQLIHCFYFF